MIKSNEIIAITFFMLYATFEMNVDEAKAINCRVFLLQLPTLGVDVGTLVVPSQGESIVRRMVEKKATKASQRPRKIPNIRECSLNCSSGVSM